MTPLEAWSVISGNLAHLYKMRKWNCYKGYSPRDTEAEVVAFKALQEMHERMRPSPLTIKKIQAMQDQPVWVEWQDAPELSCWGVVESVSTIGRYTTVYLRGRMDHINIDNAISIHKNPVRIYRYKPTEVRTDG